MLRLDSKMRNPRLYGMLRLTSGFAVIVVLALLCVAKASAHSGREDYQHYCAVCHGQDGKGKGTWNGTAVPDLTRLSRDNGRRFPSEEVQKVVDGRSQPVWHQRRRDMPYWGEIFQLEEESPASKARAEARIAAIVDYVRGLQEK
jgi:mono/diheme cytochrome c family protein